MLPEVGPTTDPPGPRHLKALALLPRLKRDPLGTARHLASTYGDLVCSRIGAARTYVVFHPNHVEHVLQRNHRNYVKGFLIGRTKVLVGEGLFSSDGERWRRQRRLIQPAFHHQRLRPLIHIMTEEIGRTLDGWQFRGRSGEPFDLAAEMHRLTLEVVGRALFGTELAADAAGFGAAALQALGFVSERAMSAFPPPLIVPTPRNLRFRRARRALDALVYRIVARRRAAAGNAADLLGLLLAARDEETGEAMSDRQLRDEVFTFVLAGHETTALALTWAWYLLGGHPAVDERLRGEVTTVLRQRTPGPEDLPALAYTRMVLEEAMRLFPPLWAFPRQAIAEDVLGGHRVARRGVIAVVPWLTHRLPAFWPHPERFEPERFAPERTRERPRWAYLPFGGGPRQCIGEDFAMTEAVLALAMTAQRYRVTLVPDRAVVPEVRTTLRPRSGLWVTASTV